MEVKPPPEELIEELKVEKEDISMFDLEGYVSSCRHGEGRATNDRQFYYINSRPCEPSKITKIINEVYHQFNMHQSPFVFLNVKVARDSVDVNVTPDKRQVFLDHEKLLVAILKASALSLYESIPSTYLMNNIPQRSTGRSCDNRNSETKTTLSKLSLWRHKSDNKRELEPQGKPERENKQLKLDKTFAFKSKQPSPRKMKNEKEIPEGKEIEPEEKMSGRVEGSGDLDIEGEDGRSEDDSISVETEENDNTSAFYKLKEYTSASQGVNTTDGPNLNENSSQDNDTDRQNPNENLSQDVSRICDTPVSDSEISSQEPDTGKPFLRVGSEGCRKTDPLLDAESSVYDTPISQSSSTFSQESVTDKSNITFDTGVEDVDGRKCFHLDLNLDKLRLAQDERLTESNSSKSSGPLIKFRAVIDPAKNDQAEKELSKEITKDMFSKMEIIGQFNLGFIISKLNSDLFIIDQHATDEKYNFETLQKTTVISNQKLVVPQRLELTAMNECILIENLEVFRKNGFEFKIDEAAPVTQKVSLTAVPMSRNWVFGKEDIDELLFMLQDSPNTLCRPSRVRAMFASRACRKSVMIGTSLSKQVMRQLVTHMGEIEQPWNCPHGRPTMRHLVNLDLTQ